MTPEERLELLEQRLAAMETLMRRHLQAPIAPPRISRAQERFAEGLATAQPEAIVSPAKEKPRLQRSHAAPKLDMEQWMGQRGILAVGVLLLLLGGGYLVNYAVAHNWISPAFRCIGLILGGHAVAWVGWRAFHRGTRTYGASLIGAGYGLVYIGIWAASRWYSLVSPEIGIVGILFIAFSTAAIAYRLDLEVLACATVVGALVAPIIISPDVSSANSLLLYLAGVCATMGTASVRRGWQATTFLTVIVTAVLALTVVNVAHHHLVLAFAVAGGLAGWKFLSRDHPSRLVVFLASWSMVIFRPAGEIDSLPIVVAAIALTAPVWWIGLRKRTIFPNTSVAEHGERWSALESFFFYFTPVMLNAAFHLGYPTLANEFSERLLLAVAIPYLLIGYSPGVLGRRMRAPFALVGTTGALIAAATWPGEGAVMVLPLIGLAFLWPLLDRLQQRHDGRWYSLAALAMVVSNFWGVERLSTGRAFVDSWAMVEWLIIATFVIFARGWWQTTQVNHGIDDEKLAKLKRNVDLNQTSFLAFDYHLPPGVPGVLWISAGVLLFLGITNELTVMANQLAFSHEIQLLIGGLAVSAWWALYAGALVIFGFYRKLAAVRIAGLVVAALAVVKVLFFDLANLDQLYRVGSAITLAVVLLLMAYLYHRQAQQRAVETALDTGTEVIDV